MVHPTPQPSPLHCFEFEVWIVLASLSPASTIFCIPFTMSDDSVCAGDKLGAEVGHSLPAACADRRVHADTNSPTLAE